jgi:ABC-type lipoprotein export system ATPase subunit
MLRIEDCVKTFGEQTVLEHTSLHIEDPGMYVICGKSGCGKSTLLNMIAGFEPLTSGRIIKDAEVMTIFQNYELIEELNVYDNIFLDRKEDPEDIQLLSRLGLDHLLQQYPDELSGGQKQRVGIARALISHPKIICCDEPTESLDVTNKEIVMEILKEYSKDHIVIMVTHQLDTIGIYADAVIRIENRKIVMDHAYHNADPIDTREMKSVEQKSVKHLVGKIIRRKNRVFITVFVVLMLIVEMTYVMKRVMFYIPETANTVNAGMIYVETDDTGNITDPQLQDPEKIVQFKNITEVNGEQFQMNIYPYVKSDETLNVSGELPKDMNVLINQNAAEALFQNNWTGQKLNLTFLVDPYSSDAEFTVTGVIEEKDTTALNVYYDLNGFMEYSKKKTLSDNRPFSMLIKEYGTYYQKKIGYEQIPAVMGRFKNNKSVKLYSPLYEERQTLDEHSRIYQYLFTAFAGIIAVLLTFAVCMLTRKETESHYKSFAILISQNADIKELKKEYVLKKTKPVIVFGILNLIALIIAQMKVSYLNVIPLIGLIAFEFVVYFVIIRISLSDMKPEKISQMLKEMNG